MGYFAKGEKVLQKLVYASLLGKAVILIFNPYATKSNLP